MKLLFAILTAAAAASAADLRIGIVGTDTSHCLQFARILNDPSSPEHVPGAQIVAAFKGGSKDIESSYTRVDKLGAELHDKWKVEIFPTSRGALSAGRCRSPSEFRRPRAPQPSQRDYRCQEAAVHR